MQLTDHFHLAHLSASETAERKGIANSPPPEHVANLIRLAAGLEQVTTLKDYSHLDRLLVARKPPAA